MSHLGRPEEGKYAEEFSLAPVAKRLTQLLGVPVALQAGLAGRRRGRARRGRAARERALQQGREEGRRRAGAEAWRRCATSTSWMPSARRIAPRRAPTGSRSTRRSPAPDRCWSASCRRSRRRSRSRRGRCSRSSPAPRSRPSSRCSSPCSSKVDQLIVGGGITNTFLAALGFNVGKSLYEPDMLDICKRLLEQSKKRGIVIPMPTDVVVATRVLRQGGGRREARRRRCRPTR